MKRLLPPNNPRPQDNFPPHDGCRRISQILPGAIALLFQNNQNESESSMTDPKDINALFDAATKASICDNDHPAFGDFCSRIHKALVWSEDKGAPFTPLHSDCDHDYRRTVAILRTIPGVDVCETIRWFRKHSDAADCDCGVAVYIGAEDWS